MADILANLQATRQEIQQLEKDYSRPAKSVQLLAVSKTKPIDAVRTAIAAGQRDFGENYLDDALTKITALRDSPCVWHFIGHIQSNKTKTIAESFDWVHTLDREKIARRLSQQRPSNLAPLNCCVQLNIDNEAAKSGINESELESLMASICDLSGITIRGLMVIPRIREDFNEQRQVFARVQDIFANLQKTYSQFDTLSMGMSADMPAAIAEGATIVRIGTAIFGTRDS